MDPAQGETQGKSMTSKLKAKVKGVKGKVHLPGHKKRHGDDAQGGNESDGSSGSSSDDSPKKPGPETGYNVGASTPFTTVRTTPLSPAREQKKPPSSRTTHEEPPRSIDTHSQDVHSTTERMAKMGHDDDISKPREGMLGKVKDTVGGAAAAVGSTMGYYTEVDQAPVEPPRQDPNAPTLMEKTKASLGLNKPSDPNAPTLMEKTKHSLGLDKPSDPNAPTMMEKTKASLGLNKPSDPNAPTMMEKTKASLGLGAPPHDSAAHPGGADMQSTFPAQTDYVPSVPHQSYEGRIGEERATITPTGGYNQTLNRY